MKSFKQRTYESVPCYADAAREQLGVEAEENNYRRRYNEQ